MTDDNDDAPVRVYVDLIGDLFHWGDVRLLERAHAIGDILVVGVIGDEDAAAASHRPVATLAERAAVIAACRHVHEVVPGAPLAPDDAFLDLYRIDYVCLSDDLGHEGRRTAFARLMDTGRAVVVPAERDISTGDFVQRIVGRASEGPALPAPPALALAPVIHPPPGAEGMGSLTPRERLETLAAGQEALLRAVGALAADRFESPFLLRERTPNLAHWATLIANFAAENLARQRPVRDDLARVGAHLFRLRRHLRSGRRVALLGDQAVAVGHALASDPVLEIVVVQPGASRTVPAGEPARHANLRVVGCDDWSGLPAILPPVDVLAVLDEHAAAYLLIAPLVLWHLAERVAEALLVVAPLTADAGDGWRPRGDVSGFVFADGFVRGALHEARFFEAGDIATFVDGVPLPLPSRISRFTYRDGLAHGRKFRFLDDRPTGAVDAPAGARIVRWYEARKGQLPEDGPA